MQVPPDEFRLPFFKEEGFVRRLCPSCGLHYWTQDPESQNCGDAPCVDYTFIGNSPVKKRYTVPEMREKFLSFFEERGHLRVSPYPVVARWRDDLMITIASIVDFQPYVTEGIIPPPGNPLVVSQPCIRFEDIDYVGYTMGRHFTLFEMGGHHAFNYENKPQIYWKDETVRYHHELLTRDLGVPSQWVTYKEGLWSGGGNAGFDLEGCVGGLEVSTLVFMMYRVIGDSFEPMPIQVVDTGYGMERWSWLSQGTASAFHTIYGLVLDEVQRWAGIEVDEKLLAETAKFSCRITSGLKEVERRKIADLLDVDPSELDRMLTPVEAVYAALDHTKSLVFILSEGIVPSNVKEGYLARLLFRRSYRLLRKVGIEDKIQDLIEAQISLWGDDFTQLSSMHDEILDMVAVETEKYQETLKRGRGLVKRYIQREKGVIPVDQLVEFYDSHGMTPEDVSEVAESVDAHSEVPEDFYSLVALRHMKEDAEESSSMKERLASLVENLEPTKLHFYEDPYKREFVAEVLEIIDDKYVILDSSGFYSEGGGQTSDQGLLIKGSDQTSVKDVQSIENVLLHEVEDSSVLKKGDRVIGLIDWNRRLALMRSHTATHLLLGAARRVLGEHAWQAGAQKGVERSRLDISHNRRLKREEIEKMENLANQLVSEGRPVSCTWLQRDEAEARFGFRLYQGGAIPGKEIRVVEVEGGWDVEACGGTHLGNTSEVGLIKILNTERVQDGIERLVFAVGPYALTEVQKRERILSEVAEVLGSPLEETREAASGLVETLKNLRHQLEDLRHMAASQLAEILFKAAFDVNGVKLVIYSEKVAKDFLIEVGNALAKIESHMVAVMFSETEEGYVIKVGEDAIEYGIHAGKIASLIAEIMGGGGGGEPHFAQGGGVDIEKLPDAIEEIKEFVNAKFK